MKRSVKKTMEATPLRCAVSANDCAATASVATGLSNNRCRPAAAASPAISAWMSGGTAKATASTSPSMTE